MKLMIVIVRDTNEENAIQVLVKNNYRVTRMASTERIFTTGKCNLADRR